jgi:AcrR family transcriptional regulator
MSDTTTRGQIVEAADQLFYRQGFEHTSFTDIADAVQISRGNFYYHFKSKDEILDAVIELRLANTRQMLDRWVIEGAGPADRIRSFIHILLANRAEIKRYGCPVGTLSTELAKLGHPAQSEANELFTLFRAWLRRQFECRLMDGHKAWIKRGFDDGVFLLVGNLQPGLGGGIVAHGASLSDLQDRVAQDPFVTENVVSAEIVEISPSRAEERLSFLLGS